MKQIVLLVSLIMGITVAKAQTQPTPPNLDSSPLDMSYYPVDYPVLKIQDKVSEPLVARVVYSRPQKRGRKLFGDLISYGQIWRLGANEATEIEFFRDVKIDNKIAKKGRYTLYALVNEDKWTVILNKETDTWGAFRYDSSKDVLRSTVAVEKRSDIAEAFSISFQKSGKGADLLFSWDDVLVRLPITW
ncbi:DUF2911 domain-containing protein [Puia dinghuensis]|uniref:DUF2911 domain-containing protein n=1 Tax=Puia dinghuensis TaxID=1792502 RepID=A0A8J2UFP4_9BACT|nr:DUF2911 domain-containing protein [Puia dinghuensis]GGB09707.1 hypothetical protein GCM10011511_36540 [Puia dinghuensis]